MTAHREEGQTAVLILGFFVVVAMLVAVVVDASAAYLQRQRLNTLADGAALAAVDGVQGRMVYEGGLTRGERAVVDPQTARSYVAAHLGALGATSTHPGLTWSVTTRGDAVLVELRAPLDLPLGIPGVGGSVVSGSASAVVVVD